MRFSAKKRTPSPSPSIASASTNPTSNTTHRITPIQTTSYPVLAAREPSPRNNNAAMSPEIIRLTLENSSLKSQLASLLDNSPGSESTLELSNLLQLANEKNDSLQHKLDELHCGLKEIEKERRLLKQSVVKDRESHAENSKRATEEIEAMRSLLTQESKRVEMLEGELAGLQEFEFRARQEMEEQKRYGGMRDKEMAVLQARVGEQERRIEVLVEEGLDLKKKIAGLRAEKSKLEDDCEELAGELENVRFELKDSKVEIEKGAEREAELSKELDHVRCALEQEKVDRETDRLTCEAKVSQLRDELSQLEVIKQQKQDKIDEMSELMKQADLQKRELEQTVREKNEVVNELQSTIEHKETTNQSLRHDMNGVQRDMEQMSIAHEEVVNQKDAEIQSLKEQKQAGDDKLVAVNDLRQRLEDQIKSQSETQAELSTKYEELETENGELATKLDETKRIIASLEKEFENTCEQVDEMQLRENALEEELSAIKERLSESQDEVASLNGHVEQMQATHADELAHASKCRAELEAGLKIEVETCNELRSKLEKMEFHLKQEAEAHNDKIEMLKSEYQAQIEENETTGAAVIEELEESIESLNKKLVHDKAEHEKTVTHLNQTISRVRTENETLERQVAEYEKQTLSHEEKIAQLNNLSQHRGEEIIVLHKELAFHRDSIEIAKRDHLKAIDALSAELNDVRLAHQEETNSAQRTINDLATQLAAAKAKLAERTQLLKELMGQVKSYKSQYEDQCGLSKQLTDSLERAKSELNEVRTIARHYEEEKNNQENRFREAMRQERQQRKAIEKQVESFDAVRKRCNEMEKENINLKDKITRQENYISKLHDRQEKDRRRAAAPLGVSKANRPSTAPLSPPKDYIASKRSGSVAKKRHYTVQEVMQGQSFTSNTSMSEDGHQNENQQPKRVIPQSMDESDLTMG